ncbi:hypothetical protein [Maribacter polysiphoniae]|nr:hypothetical protein [Maribacter polysiphoniae]
MRLLILYDMMLGVFDYTIKDKNQLIMKFQIVANNGFYMVKYPIYVVWFLGLSKKHAFVQATLYFLVIHQLFFEKSKDS